VAEEILLYMVIWFGISALSEQVIPDMSEELNQEIRYIAYT